MAMSDEVRRRRFASHLSAVRVFTNRGDEVAAFHDMLGDVRADRLSRPDWATDLTTPRRNVVVYYGHGGIGKSRLSEELQVRAAARPGPAACLIRIDFAEPSTRDPEAFLLALRAGLSSHGPTFPAFDTALALYWARRHPGTALVRFVESQPALGRDADREQMVAQLREMVEDTIDGGGLLVGGARRVAELAVGELRRRRSFARLEDECPFFASCVDEENLEEMRLHLPLLLAWDLAHVDMRTGADTVVFLDTFDQVADRRRLGRSGGLEDTVGRAAFFLGGVTFVVTSRATLDWGEARHPHLECSGPETWPGLVLGSGFDQHRVGPLSGPDRFRHLESCLMDGAASAIGPEVRSWIAEASGGMPLYLDVAVSHFVEIVAAGRTPTRSDFAGGLPEIVTRLMGDLDEEESDLFRVAALLGIFDRGTLRAAVPSVRTSTLQRFLARALVDERGDGFYEVHDLVRESVRLHDRHTPHAWEASDWAGVGGRILEHWAARFAVEGGLWADRRAQALAFWQLACLYATTDVEAEVVATITMQVQLRGAWAVLAAARSQPASLVNDRGRAFLRLIDGILTRQTGHLSETKALLHSALTPGHLGPQVRRLALYYLGETLDLLSEDVDAVFSEAGAGASDRIGVETAMASAHSHVRRGDLAQADRLASALPDSGGDPEFVYRRHELLGITHLFGGRFADAVEQFELSRRCALVNDSRLLLALATRHLALTLCWVDPPRALTVLDEALPLNRELDLPPGVGQCMVARAVAQVGVRPAADLVDDLGQAERTFLAAGYHDDALAAIAARVYVAVCSGDRPAAVAARDDLHTRAVGRRPRTWPAVADIWLGSTGTTGVQWLGPLEEARDAWWATLRLT